MATEPLLTICETADRLRVTKATVRKWIFLKTIECVRIGRSVRIPERVVGEMIRRGTQKAISLT